MTFPLFDLSGLRALVTGSSQGIGFALAQRLAEHCASVVLNGRDGAKLEAAADRLRLAGHEVAASDFDVTDADAVKRGVDTIERVRRYLPPETVVLDVSNQEIRSLCERLNATPRKCLGFQTPTEIFGQHLLAMEGQII